jgi:hypothetical protein
VTPTTKNALLEAMIGTARRGLLDDGPEVVKRGGTAPVVEYSDGTAGLGVPQGLMDVWDGARNALTNPNYFDFMNYQPGTDYYDQGMSRAARDSFNAAATAATGSVLAPRPTGSIGMGGMPRAGQSMSEYIREKAMKQLDELNAAPAAPAARDWAKKDADQTVDMLRKQMTKRRLELGGEE